MKRLSYLLLGLLLLIMPIMGQIDMSKMLKLPVLEGGRYKPMDSVARHVLLSIYSKQTIRTETERYTYSEWFRLMVGDPQKADQIPIFKVHNPRIQPRFDESMTQQTVFSFATIQPHIDWINENADQAANIETQKRDQFQRDIVSLRRNVTVYLRLKNTLNVENVNQPTALFMDFLSDLPQARLLIHDPQSVDNDTKLGHRVAYYFQVFRYMHEEAYFNVVPVVDKDWISMGEAALQGLNGQPIGSVPILYSQLVQTLIQDHPELYTTAADSLMAYYNNHHPDIMMRVKVEYWFNQLQPFYWQMVAFVAVMLVVIVFWLAKKTALLTTARWMYVISFIAYTVALVVRMWIQSRPPVTNLYSSAIFIGWMGSLFCALMDRRGRRGVMLMMGALVAFSTLIIAHHLAIQGDTMEMMRAVLDSNFWLTTHVITICIGYAMMYVAGALGLYFVFRGVFFKDFDKEQVRAVTTNVYVSFGLALLFSFVGTVLGGIWADQSWGRFWGWDPKENGALLIVLWVAIALHARLAGWVKERGLMLFAIFGNVVTSFSYFGVNMLGIGLHSYGFMDAAFQWLVSFSIAHLVVIWIGLLPTSKWRGFRSQ